MPANPADLEKAHKVCVTVRQTFEKAHHDPELFIEPCCVITEQLFAAFPCCRAIAALIAREREEWRKTADMEARRADRAEQDNERLREALVRQGPEYRLHADSCPKFRLGPGSPAGLKSTCTCGVTAALAATKGEAPE